MQVGGGAGLLEDETALRAAYAAHGSELYRLAKRTLVDGGLAEEAVQETFVRAWRASGRYDPQVASLRTWLFAIARNVIIDLARARASRPRLAVEPPGEAPDASDPSERVLRSYQVAEALERISPEHRQAIVETYFRARPCSEVARDLGIPEGTVRSRVFYGLKALRLALEEMGWTNDQ